MPPPKNRFPKRKTFKLKATKKNDSKMPLMSLPVELLLRITNSLSNVDLNAFLSLEEVERAIGNEFILVTDMPTQTRFPYFKNVVDITFGTDQRKTKIIQDKRGKIPHSRIVVEIHMIDKRHAHQPLLSTLESFAWMELLQRKSPIYVSLFDTTTAYTRMACSLFTTIAESLGNVHSIVVEEQRYLHIKDEELSPTSDRMPNVRTLVLEDCFIHIERPKLFIPKCTKLSIVNRLEAVYRSLDLTTIKNLELKDIWDMEEWKDQDLPSLETLTIEREDSLMEEEMDDDGLHLSGIQSLNGLKMNNLQVLDIYDYVNRIECLDLPSLKTFNVASTNPSGIYFKDLKMPNLSSMLLTVSSIQSFQNVRCPNVILFQFTSYDKGIELEDEKVDMSLVPEIGDYLRLLSKEDPVPTPVDLVEYRSAEAYAAGDRTKFQMQFVRFRGNESHKMNMQSNLQSLGLVSLLCLEELDLTSVLLKKICRDLTRLKVLYFKDCTFEDDLVLTHKRLRSLYITQTSGDLRQVRFASAELPNLTELTTDVTFTDDSLGEDVHCPSLTTLVIKSTRRTKSLTIAGFPALASLKMKCEEDLQTYKIVKCPELVEKEITGDFEQKP